MKPFSRSQVVAPGSLLASTAALLAILVAPPSLSAGDNGDRSYRLPNGETLVLSVPQAWVGDVAQPPGGLPPTIHFAGGNAFDIQVTPVWALSADMVLPDKAGLRAGVERIIEEIRPQSIDAEIVISELKGAATFGYYFAATDKAPKPGEYRYMTQGMVRLADLVVTFTILTNDGAGNVVGEMLAAIEGARYESPKPGSRKWRGPNSI